MFNHALPISKPRFKSIIFTQNSPKMKLVLQKNAKFLSAGGSALRPPVPPAAGGLAPRPPKQPPIANIWPCAWITQRVCFICLL